MVGTAPSNAIDLTQQTKHSGAKGADVPTVIDLSSPPESPPYLIEDDDEDGDSSEDGDRSSVVEIQSIKPVHPRLPLFGARLMATAGPQFGDFCTEYDPINSGAINNYQSDGEEQDGDQEESIRLSSDGEDENMTDYDHDSIGSPNSHTDDIEESDVGSEDEREVWPEDHDDGRSLSPADVEAGYASGDTDDRLDWGSNASNASIDDNADNESLYVNGENSEPPRLLRIANPV